MSHRFAPVVSFRLAPAVLSAAVAAAAGAGLSPPTAVIVTTFPTPGSAGNPVLSVNNPYLTRDGRVGFTGSFDQAGTTVHFVWFNGQIVWKNPDALPTVLTGAEGTMGVGDAGQWIYSPSENGNDSVWSNGAKVLTELDSSPGIPGQFISFCSRPQMNADGSKTWISGITASQGTGAQFRALYKQGDGDAVVILKGGDIVSGESLVTAGTSVGFNYDFSTDGTNYIVRGLISAPTASNDVIIANGAIIARESFSTGGEENWQTFGDMKTNNDGDVVFSGDTDGPAATDGFLALNDALVLREGDSIAPKTVLVGNPNAVGLNDLGQYGAIWNTSAGETLFVVTPGIAGPFTSILLQVGDGVDLDGDGDVDGFVTDFTASQGVSPGLDLPRQCQVCATVNVQPIGGTEVTAVVCVPMPFAFGLADLDGDGVVAGADLAILLGGWGSPGVADLNCDGTVGGADLAILLGAWS
jgi:hypothetical protein